jgi:pimeloyl-ACP methyl ester carboxylesterase
MTFVPWIKWFGGANLIRKQIRKGLIKVSGDTTWVTDDVVNGYTAGAQANLDGTLKAFLAMAASKEPEKLKPHLPDIRVPVRLLLGGAPHDGGPSKDEVRELQAGLPQLVIETVPGAGHYLHEEQPRVVVGAVEEAARAMTTRVGAGPHRSAQDFFAVLGVGFHLPQDHLVVRAAGRHELLVGAPLAHAPVLHQ